MKDRSAGDLGAGAGWARKQADSVRRAANWPRVISGSSDVSRFAESLIEGTLMGLTLENGHLFAHCLGFRTGWFFL